MNAIREKRFLNTDRRAAPATEEDLGRDVGFQQLHTEASLPDSDSGSFYSSSSHLMASDNLSVSAFASSDEEMPESFYHIPEVPSHEDLSDSASYVPSLFIPNVPDFPSFDDDSVHLISVLDIVLFDSESSIRESVIASMNAFDDLDSSVKDESTLLQVSENTAQMYYSSDDPASKHSSCNRQDRQARYFRALKGKRKLSKVTNRKKPGWSMPVFLMEEEPDHSSDSSVSQSHLKDGSRSSENKEAVARATNTTHHTTQKTGPWRMTIERDRLYASSNSESDRKRHSDTPPGGRHVLPCEAEERSH
ncbi:OLC1v1035753C1 [Oldenlandia corymbosa var. corymbosa]|uniref:OLC1v1035753C1 n=1 Tax=Oldenlandia corymbosa var. corymbosa TaxID=529605 RepID=A0AAV1CW92_OLDCO|nr:OLC1v1035753C1 [Oldenlandia corymbosa var. corymbosa]